MGFGPRRWSRTGFSVFPSNGASRAIDIRRPEGVLEMPSVQVSLKNGLQRRERESVDVDSLRHERPVQPAIAFINESSCRGCGRCELVCPEEAIRIDQVAVVDTNRCRGCGLCVSECPLGAITLKVAHE
jgi:ferredoxin